MKVKLHSNFEKQFAKLRMNEKKQAKDRLVRFVSEPFSPELRNHPLKGKYRGYRSINITGDLRAVYKNAGKDEAVFVAIGSHSELYS